MFYFWNYKNQCAVINLYSCTQCINSCTLHGLVSFQISNYKCWHKAICIQQNTKSLLSLQTNIMVIKTEQTDSAKRNIPGHPQT
ncbi:hypothetical protein Hanom_Chr08g00684491 [Helianthus anomalus]